MTAGIGFKLVCVAYIVLNAAVVTEQTDAVLVTRRFAPSQFVTWWDAGVNCSLVNPIIITIPNGHYRIDKELVIPAPCSVDLRGHRVVLDAINVNRLFSVNQRARLQLQNLVLMNGHTSGNGGMIKVNGYGATLRLYYCVIMGSTSLNSGGAVYGTTGSSIFIYYSRFSRTTALSGGGAIAGIQVYIRIESSRFEHTNATHGGVVAVTGPDSQLRLYGSQFSDSHVSLVGGAVYAYTMDYNWQHGPMVLVQDCVFSSTSAWSVQTLNHGGAIHSQRLYMTNSK